MNNKFNDNIDSNYHEKNINLESQDFQFIRHKSLGRLDISHIISDLKITGEDLTIVQQKIVLYFFKKNPIKTVHNINDIASIKVKRIFDISDMIFSVIFASLGLSQPVFFIVAAILFWVGMGKKIEIKKKNNFVITIPTGSSTMCSSLVKSINRINKSIVVENINSL